MSLYEYLVFEKALTSAVNISFLLSGENYLLQK